MSHAATPDTAQLLAHDNVTMGPGAGRLASATMIILGIACAAVTLVSAFVADEKLAMRAASLGYHIGFVVSAAITLGALGFVMILHQTGAVWSAAIRRQYENVASLIPVIALLFIPILALSLLKPGAIFKWMDAAYVAGDVIYEHKRPYLNTTFFVIRQLIYFAVWAFLSMRLVSMSRAQDQNGDKWLTNRMRRLSAPGLLLFALTTAFAGFDWIMALDYHWFSTMFGVYYFAVGILGAMAIGVLTLILIRRSGRLDGVVSDEHMHDLGKLLFGLTVFWAYIGFSQYFLIWYANIPEETAFFTQRRQGELLQFGSWLNLSAVLIVGKFVVPFLVLLPRPARRNHAVLVFISLWILAMTAIDMFYMVRAELFAGHPQADLGLRWTDVVGPAGPILIFLGALLHRVASTPLVPLQDPRLPRSIAHRNTI